MHPIEKRSLEHRPLSVGRLLLEMAMIVFGILLALNLETCKERRHERELAETALNNIRLEIAQNRKAVAENIPTHKELAEVLMTESDRMGRLLRESRGAVNDPGISVALRPTVLYRTAWETAGMTRALSRVEYGLLLKLSDIYESQRWMALIEDKWLQAFSNPASFELSRRPWMLAIFSSLANNYAQIEESLLKSYDEALAKLPPEREAPAP